LDVERWDGILTAMTDQTKDSKQDEDKANYLEWAGVGIEFCAVIVVFCYIGYRLDKALNTEPWLLILFAFLGFAGMLYRIIKRAMTMSRR
jgi:F0F1-type ATP synthase assembly protein I